MQTSRYLDGAASSATTRTSAAATCLSAARLTSPFHSYRFLSLALQFRKYLPKLPERHLRKS